MIDYILFGIVDNGIMILGAIYGLHLEKYFPTSWQRGTGAVIGAGVGNAISDWAGGAVSANWGLAFGTFFGCLIALLLVPGLLWLKKQFK